MPETFTIRGDVQRFYGAPISTEAPKNRVTIEWINEMIGAAIYENVRVLFIRPDETPKSFPDEPTLWINPSQIKSIKIEKMEDTE